MQPRKISSTMPLNSNHQEQPRPHTHRAAVFVDYENLYDLLRDRLGSREHPDEYIMRCSTSCAVAC